MKHTKQILCMLLSALLVSSALPQAYADNDTAAAAASENDGTSESEAETVPDSENRADETTANADTDGMSDNETDMQPQDESDSDIGYAFSEGRSSTVTFISSSMPYSGQTTCTLA